MATRQDFIPINQKLESSYNAITDRASLLLLLSEWLHFQISSTCTNSKVRSLSHININNTKKKIKADGSCNQDGQTLALRPVIPVKTHSYGIINSAVADQDLQIRRGPGHPDTEIREGGWGRGRAVFFFRPFGHQFGPKLRTGGGGGHLPCIRHSSTTGKYC